MDNEAELKEGFEVTSDDVVDDPLVEEEIIDDGSMTGDEESDEAEIMNHIYDEVYGDQN